VQDTKIFEAILGITAPSHIARVELKTDEQRVELWGGARAHAVAAPRVRRGAAPLIMPRNERGAISTRASFRHTCMPRFRASSVRRMASSRSACRGPSREAGSPCKQEHRRFLRAGQESPLTGTKYVWLFSDERRPEYHAETFATLQVLNLKVARAWAIKEALARSGRIVGCRRGRAFSNAGTAGGCARGSSR
jgi:hypothetical protein